MKNPACTPKRWSWSNHSPRSSRHPLAGPSPTLPPPYSTSVLGCPSAPGTGSDAEPVVARGTGSGASFVHQTRYSERSQNRVASGEKLGKSSGPGGGTYTGGTYARGSG